MPNRKSLHAIKTLVQRELAARHISPELAVLMKQTVPGGSDLPEIVNATEFYQLAMRVGYERAVAIIRARLNLLALEQGVQAYRSASTLSAVLEAAHANEVAQEFRRPATEASRGAFMRGSGIGARRLRESARVNIRFDIVNPQAVAYAETRAAELVTHIDETQREAVRILVTSAVENGRTVQETARDVRNVVGLRPDQAAALLNYRERVSQRDLTIDEVERKVERYAAALLKQRGELIARTEILRAANQGQLALWRVARQQGLLQAGAMKTWITTPDELLCPDCEPLDGVAVGLDDPWESDIGSVDAPPLHPNCFLPGTNVSGKFEAGLKAVYSGPAVELTTRKGHRLSVTANHPVLTDRGWIAANRICKSNNVLSQNPMVVWPVAFRHVEDQQTPPTVEDVVDALSLHGLSTNKICRLDLHGDAQWTDGQVDVVGGDLMLQQALESGADQRFSDGDFQRRDLRQFPRDHSRMFDFRRHADDPSATCLPRSGQLAFDQPSVLLEDSPLDQFGFGLASHPDLQIPKGLSKGGPADPDFTTQLLHRGAGSISFDQVVHVRHFHFSGHVYDLQSESGWIIASGIVTSNCRCSMGIVVVAQGQDEDAGQ